MMTEHSLQRSTTQSSGIPVVTPRNSRCSTSSTFPTPQTSSHISQTRRASESTQARPATSTSVTLTLPQTPVSSIPSFRSFRNLLPFGPPKTPNPPAPNPAQTPKPSFVNFGSLRRNANDRKNSASYSRPNDTDQAPVIAIAKASETFEEEMMARKRSRDLGSYGSDSTPFSRTSEERYVLPALSPGSPLGADLSTIIEADNSGFSKYIPFLDDTTHIPDADSGSPPSPFNLDQDERSRQPSPDSREASFLDLSTSKLTAEVLHALKVKDSTTATEWLKGVNGVVVEEGPDDRPHRAAASSPRAEDDEAAFDFGALDPDLAELLSPNRINGESLGSKPPPSRLPSRTHLRNSSHPLAKPSFSSLNTDAVSPQTSPLLSSIVPPTLPSRAIAQSSPTRRTASLSRASQAQATTSSLPRLMRSVSNAPPSTNPPSEGSSTPTSLRGATKKRHQPPSPLSSQTHSSQTPSPVSSRGSSELPPRRLPGSRLVAPICHVSSYVPGNSHLADAPIIHPPPAWEKALAGSQVSSRSASDPMRQPNTRPSLDFGGTLEVNKRRRAHLFYNRKRSQSVEDARLSPTGTSASTSSRASPTRPCSSLSNRPPAMEWLGPRTVKAFAAAGLLDGDREGSSVHASGPGRYATLRASNEREDRFVPSRMAFSEAASTSSWGRSGSVSRGMTPSESGVTWAGSPTFSAPRTTFSGGSTAPTSISASSSAQQATIQLMKEKHDLETEALLSALSDSQRTTKTLRDENLQLRDRIRELEEELDDMRTQLHRLASGVLQPRPPPSALPKSVHDRRVIPPSPLGVPRRPIIQRSHSHLHANNASVSSVDLGARACEESPSRDDLLLHPRRRRASTTSSVFPNLPPNMSMLMLEDTMHDRDPFSTSSVSPPLPTHGLPRRSSVSNISRGEHITQSSMSSCGNISPTAASFSLTEIPGSPASLQLRPEHEMHLGDMATLSLYAMSDEEL